jgi:serine/threonine protein kinase/tetratricopeptide (TPR) repeat protein
LTAGSSEDAPEPEPAVVPNPSAGVVSRLLVRRDFLERYDFLEYIGQGGQGDLWKVWDFEFRRVVAMKCLAAGALQSDSAVYRFIAEAQLASQLEHPGVLPIFDAGLDPDGRPFYTTQLLPGTTFGDIWRKVHDPTILEWQVNRALELLLRVCDVMGYAHNRGVIHRDLKPSNILVGAFGDVRVIDWGSAHVLRTGGATVEEPFVAVNQMPIQTDREKAIQDDPGSPLSTGASGLPMTVLFTAPELLRGDMGEIGPQTDVYSMGVMLYELIAGQRPYSDDHGELPPVEHLKELIKNGSPAHVGKVNPKASRDLAAICEKAMAHEKCDRYSSMQMLADDIRAALELRPVRARRPGPVLKAQRFAQRHAGYVLLICLIAVVVAVGFAVSGRLRRQRDVALQVQALRDGELAARNGHWREALRHWDEAQSAGYNDTISLGLQRAEAWTVLNQPDRSGAELRKLMRRPDLGEHRDTVLLNMGDYELFDKATAKEGEAHVRQALAAGLSRADQLVAEGLLAESVPNALLCFQHALRIDPYSYAAHIHSLGIEFVLGRHAELANDIRVFLILYPDDPSPRYLAAMESALGGRLPEATAALEPLRQSMSESSWNKLVLGYRRVGDAASCLSIDVFLKGDAFDSRKFSQLMLEAGSLIAGSLPGSITETPRLREPHLPCLEHGFLDAVAAVQALNSPFYRDITPAIAQIKSGWQLCPEATVPFRAAALLEARHPAAGPKSIPLLAIQAELFQMASDSQSFVPGLPRTSRYMATKAELELIQSQPTNVVALRNNCLRNVRAAASDAEASGAESRAYFTIACELGDYDSAKQLLDRRAMLASVDADLRHDRVELAILSGNFESAIRMIDSLLAHNTDDAWALRQRQVVIEKLEGLLRGIQSQPAEPENKTTGK